jgi:hypothetical protein
MRKTLCDNCHREVDPKNEFRDRGKVFCTKRCRDYFALVKIEKNARLWGATMWVFAFIGTLLLGAFTGQAMGHDPYMDWKDKDGKSCCNGIDCAPAKARFQNGDWYAQSPFGWVKVPEDKILRRHSPDNESHLCFNVHTKEVLCFVRAPSGM